MYSELTCSRNTLNFLPCLWNSQVKWILKLLHLFVCVHVYVCVPKHRHVCATVCMWRSEDSSVGRGLSSIFLWISGSELGPLGLCSKCLCPLSHPDPPKSEPPYFKGLEVSPVSTLASAQSSAPRVQFPAAHKRLSTVVHGGNPRAGRWRQVDPGDWPVSLA